MWALIGLLAGAAAGDFIGDDWGAVLGGLAGFFIGAVFSGSRQRAAFRKPDRAVDADCAATPRCRPGRTILRSHDAWRNSSAGRAA